MMVQCNKAFCTDCISRFSQLMTLKHANRAAVSAIDFLNAALREPNIMDAGHSSDYRRRGFMPNLEMSPLPKLARVR
jgi:hypothetical protein